MGKYYVYVHRRNTTNKVFYVGQGRGKRAWSKSGRNQHWHRIIARDGYSVQIIMDGMDQICAMSMERALISFHGRDNLCNLTDGGDIGPTGLKHTKEVREAQSRRLIGNTHTLGRKLTDEHKRAISEALLKRYSGRERPKPSIKGRKRDAEWTANLSAALRGRKLSEEHKAKLSAANKGRRTGPDNPAYGVPKTPEQKAVLSAAMRGRKFSPETLAKRSGENHPRYDGTEYTMYHVEHGTVTATRLHFRDVFGIESTKFTALLKGRRKNVKGWSILD